MELMILPLPVLIILWIIGAVLALNILWWLFIIVCSLFINPNKEYKKNSKFCRFLLYFSTDLAMIYSRVHVHSTGEEKIPEGRFLLVSNHLSNFDPIIQWYVLKKSDLAFISKPENFNIIAFGKIVRKCCFLPINRSDARESVKTLFAAAELVKSGEVSMGIFPEGTRSKSGELLPFHDGVLKIAKSAGVPIVVTVMKDTDKIAKNFPWHRSKVCMDIIKVYDTETVKAHSTHELAALVREDMLQHLEKER